MTNNFYIKFDVGSEFSFNMPPEFHSGFVLMYNSVLIDGDGGNIENYERYDLDELDDEEDPESGPKLISQFDGEDWWDECVIMKENPDLEELRKIDSIMNLNDFRTFEYKFHKDDRDARAKHMADNFPDYKVIDYPESHERPYGFSKPNLISYRVINSDGDKVFAIAEYSDQAFLQGMFAAIAWHGKCSVEWGHLIDMSDPNNWTHRRFV